MEGPRQGPAGGCLVRLPSFKKKPLTLDELADHLDRMELSFRATLEACVGGYRELAEHQEALSDAYGALSECARDAEHDYLQASAESNDAADRLAEFIDTII